MPDNPYVTVDGPNYGAGLMNWQGLLNQGQPQKPKLTPQQAQDLAKPMPNTMGPEQTRGLGQMLQTWLNPRGPQSAPVPSMQGAPQPQGSATFADRFNAAYPQAPNSGNWAGGWDVNG